MANDELQQTALHDLHIKQKGKMVPFGGWSMPIHYGSQIEEHQAVRTAVGMFDVSHMTIVDIEGEEADQFLQTLIANDVAKLSQVGAALYTAMLNDQGGIIDDLIVYKMASGFRLVVNCATRATDLAWFDDVKARLHLSALQIKERPELAIIAVQGPKAVAVVSELLGGEVGSMLPKVKKFQGISFNRWFIGRTGYTGEDGVEVMLPAEDATILWERLVEQGVKPCGLGARDTLRLEAGLNLYGNDMDTTVTPLESNIAWTVAWGEGSRDFIGRSVLEAQKAEGPKRKLVGLTMKGRGVLRAGQRVMQNGVEVGITTSGSYSPTLENSIALARIQSCSLAAAADQAGSDENSPLFVEIRGKLQPVELTVLPFVKSGA